MIPFRRPAEPDLTAAAPRGRHVLAAAADRELIGAVGAAIRRLGPYSLEIARRDPVRPPAGVAGAAAVVLEVDARSPSAAGLVRRISRQALETAIVVAAPGAAAEDVRALFRAGAADVLTGPFTAEILQASLGEVLKGEAGQGGVRGAVISVLKGRGGAGATSFALNLAALLALGDQKRGRPPRGSAVLDLDLQFGDAALQLDLQPRSTVIDLLRAKDRLDPRLLEAIACDHASGVKLLAAPPTVVPLDAITADLAVEALDHAAVAFERTVVDLPASWSDWTLPVLGRSDLIVLVTTASVSGAVGARRVLDGLKEAGVQTPVFLVLNQLEGLLETLDKPGRISRSLGAPVDAALPRDGAAARAADRGQLVTDAFPGSRLAKDLRACAAKIDARLEALSALAQGMAA